MAGSPTIASLFAQRVVVGVGDMGVSNNQLITLSTYALGSCVGVAVYDIGARVGGLLHLMLPDSAIAPEKAAAQPAMFADTGLPLLLRAMAGMKGERHRLRCFVAGGANVLEDSANFKIGERNIRTTLLWLQQQGIPVRNTALGGVINRTMHLDIGSGTVTLKTPLSNERLSLAA